MRIRHQYSTTWWQTSPKLPSLLATGNGLQHTLRVHCIDRLAAVATYGDEAADGDSKKVSGFRMGLYLEEGLGKRDLIVSLPVVSWTRPDRVLL